MIAGTEVRHQEIETIRQVEGNLITNQRIQTVIDQAIDLSLGTEAEARVDIILKSDDLHRTTIAIVRLQRTGIARPPETGIVQALQKEVDHQDESLGEGVPLEIVIAQEAIRRIITGVIPILLHGRPLTNLLPTLPLPTEVGRILEDQTREVDREQSTLERPSSKLMIAHFTCANIPSAIPCTLLGKTHMTKSL
jgi:hypothetical protein